MKNRLDNEFKGLNYNFLDQKKFGYNGTGNKNPMGNTLYNNRMKRADYPSPLRSKML